MITSQIIKKPLKLVARNFFLYLDTFLNKKGTIFLLYHEVTPHIGPHNANLAMTPEVFEAQMAYLKRTYEVINLKEFLSLRSKTKNTSKNRTVVITFDDGLKGNFDYALPILKNYGLKATIFVTTSFVGKSAKFSPQLRRWTTQKENENDIMMPFLSWDEIRIMLNQNIEIGAHTCSHPFLSQIPFDEAKREIVESKNLLEKTLGTKVDFFAYPFGDLNDDIVDLVSRSGFSAACALYPGGINNYYSDRFSLKRHSVPPDATMHYFKLTLTHCFKYNILASTLRQKLQ